MKISNSGGQLESLTTKNKCNICEKELTYTNNKYCLNHKIKKRDLYKNTLLEPTYKVWINLISRIKYDAYGMDPKWKTFKGFLEDMGHIPEGTHFCKVYNGEGYYKDNCHYKVKKVKAK